MRRRLPVLVGLSALGLLLGLRLADPAPVAQLREAVFDTYQRLSPRPFAETGVRIVAIDEASLARLGQWPWPRGEIARLVERLRALGAAAIAFDIVFAEPDRTAPARILPDLPEAARAALAALPDPDDRLAAAIAGGRVVTGFAADGAAPPVRPPRPAGLAVRGPDPAPALPGFAGATVSLPAIAEASAGHGSIAVAPGFDAVIRAVPLFQRVGGEVYPTLPAEALRVAQGARAHVLATAGGGGTPVTVTAARIGHVTVPTTAAGALRLWDTGRVPARRIPAWQVLAETPPPGLRARIAGHVVLVGATAAGLRDLRVTPVGTAVPGVEIHAQALEQMILGQHLLRPDWATGLEAVLFLALGGVLVLLLPRTGAVAASAIGLAAAGAAVGGSWWAFAEHRFLLDPVYPALGALAVYVPTVATLYAMTEREKRFVRRAFSQYLSPTLVARLAERPQELRLAGEDRALTLMFCDIRGFTGLSEAMSAEALTRFMNRYLTAMSAPVLESRGTIDKYIGDAIMAFWNAPLDDPEHPAHACEAALGMRAALVALNARLAAEPDAPPLPRSGVAIGTGLHSGHCRVGNMGSETRFTYTVIGDAVNLAARIEGQCKTYGVDILLSDATREGAGPGFRTLEADLIRVRGRRAPVRVHALVGRVPEAGAAEDGFAGFAAHHDAMLAAWRGRDWEGTRAAAEALAEEIAARPAWLPEGCRLAGLYALYRSRAERCAAAPPPPDWDGVTGGEG